MANVATVLDSKAIIAAKQAFVDCGTIDHPAVSPGVYRSWARCLCSSLRQDNTVEFMPVHRSDLLHLRDANQHLLDVSGDHLKRLAETVSGAGYIVLLTDHRGFALNVVGMLDRRDGPMWQAHRNGVNLSEPVVGTTAMTCAMAERSAINIFGHEHFLANNHIFQCSAAPIIDPQGNVIGAVDVTRTTHLPNPGSLMLVKQCAHEIESELFVRVPSFLSIRLCWHPTKESNSDSLLLAFGSDGQVIAMNEKARIFLNCHQKGRRLIFEDLFDEQFGAFLNRFRHANGALALLTNSGLSLFVTPAPRHELALRRVSNFAVSSLVENPAYKDTPVGVEFGDPGIDIQLTAAIKAAKAGLPVLVLGETGTGKEVIANLLHEAITGNRGDLIAINCAAVPESLIESELFGHVEGAFTGSKRGGAPGKIELADGGTLFLDEIGDMPLALQARLLRVLETKSVSRLGSGSTRKVDFRLVCATHQDIASAVQEGRFRRDLYYRINGAIVKLPTLRERRNIKALTTRLLHELTQGARSLSDDALILISLHSWPGNIRELRHALTYAHAMAPDGEPLRPEDFRLAEGSAPLSQFGESNRSRPSSLATLEKNAVANAMLVSNGHVGRAAATLGISRSTLYRWLKKQG